MTNSAARGHARPVQAVLDAVGRMAAAPADSHQLDDLAGATFYSPFHFHRLFRDLTGIPPAQYLAAIRMRKAMSLLADESTSVSETASTVGYESPGTFATQFLRLVGVSPGRFRALMRAHGETEFCTAVRSFKGSTATVPLSFVGADGLDILCALFPAPIPRGQPAGFVVRPAEGPPTAATSPGTFHAMAVAAAPHALLREVVLESTPTRLGSAEFIVPAVHHCEIAMRPRQPLDPPLLAWAPVLSGTMIRHSPDLPEIH